jgi:hypothetical protein
MSVHVALRGRLGANLFQYSFGRLIAEGLGLQLECVTVSPQSAFAGNCATTLRALAGHFPDAPLSIAGDTAMQPVESYEFRSLRGWGGQSLSCAAILANTSRRHLRFDGYFQRFEYYAKELARVRRWFRMTASLPTANFKVAEDDVVVHIWRGPEAGLQGWVLPLSYYSQILERLGNCGRVYICGSDLDDASRQQLSRFGSTFVTGSVLEDFRFIRRFKRIVLSNSPTAWWASLLSDATEIYGPRSEMTGLYAFTGFRDVDLHMREERYREVPVRGRAWLDVWVDVRMRNASFYSVDAGVLVDFAGSPPISIDASGGRRDLLVWLASQSRVRANDIAAAFPKVDVTGLLADANDKGLVVLDYRYTEPV